MSSLHFVKQAAVACEEAEQACDDQEPERATRLFRDALHHYQNAILVEKDEEGKARILHQCQMVMQRIREIDPDHSEEEEEDDEGDEGGERKSKKKKRHREKRQEKAAAPVPSGGHGDFHEELRSLRLSGEQLGNLAWDDIIGLAEVKEQLLMCTKVPLELPHLFQGELSSSKGILLYGPPGVGKTRIMKALARQSGMAFLAVTTADIVSKYLGESVRYIRALFEVAREQRPCILFIDEIDGLCGSRDSNTESGELKRAVGQLLQELDGVRQGQMQGILFVGATNLPWALDSGILRRVPRRYYVPLPDHEARAALLQYNCQRVPCGFGPPLSAETVWLLASDMADFSGADIASVVETAYLRSVTHLQHAGRYKGLVVGEQRVVVPARDDEEGRGVLDVAYADIKNKAALLPLALSEEDVRAACLIIKPSVNQDTLARYEQWTVEHGKKV